MMIPTVPCARFEKHSKINIFILQVNLKEVVFTKDPSKPFQELDYSKMIYGEECKGV